MDLIIEDRAHPDRYRGLSRLAVAPPPSKIILAVPEAPHKSPFLFLLVLSHSVSRGCVILELLCDANEQGWSCLKGGKAVAMRRGIEVWFGYLGVCVMEMVEAWFECCLFYFWNSWV